MLPKILAAKQWNHNNVFALYIHVLTSLKQVLKYFKVLKIEHKSTGNNQGKPPGKGSRQNDFKGDGAYDQKEGNQKVLCSIHRPICKKLLF